MIVPHLSVVVLPGFSFHHPWARLLKNRPAQALCQNMAEPCCLPAYCLQLGAWLFQLALLALLEAFKRGSPGLFGMKARSRGWVSRAAFPLSKSRGCSLRSFGEDVLSDFGFQQKG